MDIGAYAQIENLSEIASANGINVPRLRGYRLMSNEKAVTDEEIKSAIKDATMWAGERACTSRFTFGSWSEYSLATDNLKKKYLIMNDEGDTVGIRWNKIHGKHRKALKFAIKKKERAIKEQMEMFNKYVGRNDVLYVHSRTGGGNWYYYYKEIRAIPGLLDRIEDANDCTYADYYFKIKPVVKEEKANGN